MFNPIITPQLRTLGRDSLAGELQLEEKLDMLYQDSQGEFRKPIYYDGAISESEFRQGADFAEFIQQWKILAEKIKTWMSEKGISLIRKLPIDGQEQPRSPRELNQDQILDRFIRALEDPQGTHIQSTPELGNSAKKSLEKAVLILKNTKKPIDANAGESALTEFLEGILMCAPRCANDIQSLFETLYQKHEQDIRLTLFRQKTEFLKNALLIPTTPPSASPFDVIALQTASLLYPDNEELRNNEFLAFRETDQIHLICLIQERLSELSEELKFVTQFDRNDYFKNALLSRIQRIGGEQYLQKMTLDLLKILGARYHPIHIVQKIAGDLVEEIENFFPTDQMVNYEQAKKVLGPWKEKIVFEEMYALNEKDGKTYLNKQRLYQELFSAISEELFQRDFFDRSFTQLGSQHFYVNGHLQLSWVSNPITQEGRQIAIQEDSSIRVTPSEKEEDFWLTPQQYLEEKIFLTPDHWESFSLASEKTKALEILLKDSISTRDILLEMRSLGTEQKHFIYISNFLQNKHLSRDVVTLLWHFLFLKDDIISQEKIKYFINIKIGPSSIVELLKDLPSAFLQFSQDPLINNRALHIENLFQYLYSINWRDFSFIKASEQDFRDIALPGSIFDRAVLSKSSFAKCDLTAVSFKEATLDNVEFVGSSILKDVDFSSADLTNAFFQKVSLSEVKNLETALLEAANFHLVQFSAAQLEHETIRNALRKQIEISLQKMNYPSRTPEDTLFWVEIYKELARDNRNLITRALTEESADRIRFLFSAFQKLPLSRAKELVEVVKIILTEENPQYLQHASTIFEATDSRGTPLLDRLIEIQAFPLFSEFLSVIREIGQVSPSLVTTIFSKNSKNPLLYSVISTQEEDPIRLLLDIVIQLPPQKQITLLSLIHPHGTTILFEAVQQRQTKTVSKLCSMISPLLKKDHSLFAQFTLAQDPIFKLTPLEKAIFLPDAQMVSSLLDLFDQAYVHNPELVLSGIFLEKEIHNASPFQENFLLKISESVEHKMIIDRLFKTLERMNDPSIFDRYIPSQLPFLALTMKYLSEDHLLILLDILKNYPDPQKALELLYFKAEDGNRLFDQLSRSRNLLIRNSAKRIETHLHHIIWEVPFPICPTRNPRHKRFASPCDRDSLLKEVESLESYHFDSTWNLSSRELGFLLHFAERESLLAKIPMKDWSKQMTKAHEARAIDLYQQIHQAKQTSVLSQELEVLLTEAQPKTLWIHHEGHSFFLSIDSSSRKNPYILYDLWLFKEPQVFLDPKGVLRALSDLYQIDPSSKEYQAYDLDLLDPNGEWKRKTQKLLNSIISQQEAQKSSLSDFFSLQGETILDQSFAIEAKSPLLKDLWFRPRDFLHRHDRMSQKELLEVQAILKEQKKARVSSYRYGPHPRIEKKAKKHRSLLERICRYVDRNTRK